MYKSSTCRPLTFKCSMQNSMSLSALFVLAFDYSAVNLATASTKNDLTFLTQYFSCRFNRWSEQQIKQNQTSKIIRKHSRDRDNESGVKKLPSKQTSEKNLFARRYSWAHCKQDYSCISALCSPRPQIQICDSSSWLKGENNHKDSIM